MYISVFVKFLIYFCLPLPRGPQRGRRPIAKFQLGGPPPRQQPPRWWRWSFKNDAVDQLGGNQ